MWECIFCLCPVAESGPLLRDSDVLAVLGSNVLPVFRLLHAQVAAAAAVLAKNIRMATGHTPVSAALHAALTEVPADIKCARHGETGQTADQSSCQP